MRKNNLKDQLIRLGSVHPELRSDLRPILASLDKAGYVNGDYGDQSLNRSFYPEEGHEADDAIGVPAGGLSRSAARTSRFSRTARAGRKTTMRKQASRVSERDLMDVFPEFVRNAPRESVDFVLECLNGHRRVSKGDAEDLLMEVSLQDRQFGVEYGDAPTMDDGFLYINTGDTYNATLIYDYNTGELYLTDCGTMLEAYDRAFYYHNFSEPYETGDVFFAIALDPNERVPAEKVREAFNRPIRLGGGHDLLEWTPAEVTLGEEAGDVNVSGSLRIGTHDFSQFLTNSGAFHGEDFDEGDHYDAVMREVDKLIQEVMRGCGVRNYSIPYDEIETGTIHNESVDYPEWL